MRRSRASISISLRAREGCCDLAHNIDSPFITQLEQRYPTVQFQRIDADVMISKRGGR